MSDEIGFHSKLRIATSTGPRIAFADRPRRDSDYQDVYFANGEAGIFHESLVQLVAPQTYAAVLNLREPPHVNQTRRQWSIRCPFPDGRFFRFTMNLVGTEEVLNMSFVSGPYVLFHQDRCNELFQTHACWVSKSRYIVYVRMLP